MIYDFKTPYGEDIRVTVQREQYHKGGIALEMIMEPDGEPYTTCTKWIPGLKEDEVAVKNYSENEGVLDFLVRNKIIEKPHRQEQVGFVSLYISKVLNI